MQKSIGLIVGVVSQGEIVEGQRFHTPASFFSSFEQRPEVFSASTSPKKRLVELNAGLADLIVSPYCKVSHADAAFTRGEEVVVLAEKADQPQHSELPLVTPRLDGKTVAGIPSFQG